MDYKLFFKITVIIFCLSIVAILFFKHPAILPIFNLSKTESANIGNALSGILSPILNTITIYFIWQTYSAQAKNNKEQQGKNEQDLVLVLIDQMTNEYNNLSIIVNKKVNGKEVDSRVHEAGGAFIRFSQAVAALESGKSYEYFRNQMLGDSILYIMSSFEIITYRIAQSSIDKENKAVLMKKMQLFFDLKIDAPLRILVGKFINETDKYALDMHRFYNKYAETKVVKAE